MVNRDGVRHDMDIPAEISAPIVKGIDQKWSHDFAAMCQPVFFMLGSASILRSGLRQYFDSRAPRLLIWSRTHCYMLLGLRRCFACSLLLFGLHQYSDFTCFGFRQCSDKLGQEDRHGN
jgi:hypothetical protein